MIDLQQASYIAEIAASIGVILSMLFVGWQVRQNTTVLHRSEANETVSHLQELRLLLAGNKDLAEIFVKSQGGLDKLNPAELLRFDSYIMDFTWAIFYVWDRFEKGLLPKDEFGRIFDGRVAQLYAAGPTKVWWEENKPIFRGDFAEFIDQLAAEELNRIVEEDAHDLDGEEGEPG